MTERWLPIPGYEGHYEASDAGRIRGVDRIVSGRPGQQTSGRRVAGKILSAWLRPSGDRLMVRLYKDGKRTHKGVGQLVLMTFVGPRPDGMECCHNNGSATDNRVENLRWDTHSANVLDCVAHGTHNGARKKVCVRGHLIPPDKPKRRQCPACQAEDYQKRRGMAQKVAA